MKRIIFKTLANNIEYACSKRAILFIPGLRCGVETCSLFSESDSDSDYKVIQQIQQIHQIHNIDDD